MSEDKSKVDLSQLNIPIPDIKELLSQILFYEDKKEFFEIVESKRFEEDKMDVGAKLLNTAQRKMEGNNIRELTKEECAALLKYIVALLGGKFFEVFSQVIENQVKKSLSVIRSGIIGRNTGKEQDEMVNKTIISFFQRLNKELLLKWVFFLDSLPSTSRDETEEAEVREHCERIVECLTKATIKGDSLKANDWRILKNCLLYYGAGHYFKEGAHLPENAYFGVLPYSVDSLVLGLSQSGRPAFIRKSVEERLSLLRPPVLAKDALKGFLMGGSKNHEILGSLEVYYKNLTKDIKRRRGSLRIFSMYYETLADAVHGFKEGSDKMLQPAYLDSIYYALNFEDFRNLNEDGSGTDLHTKGKWLRLQVARHLDVEISDLFLQPMRNLRAAIQKGSVEVYVPLPHELKKAKEEARQRKVEKEAEAISDKNQALADALAQALDEAEGGAASVTEEVPLRTEEVPAMEDVMEDASRDLSPQASLEDSEMIPPPTLSAKVIRENRNKHVLPINPSNIGVALIGNQPPAIFHENDEEEDGKKKG